MFKVEAHNMVVYTCTISDEDEKRIKEHIKSNPDKFSFMPAEQQITLAIEDLDIELYKDCTESDSYTNGIEWSEFEERSGEEILEDR